MASFSSVIRKGNQKITPKVATRRNIVRKTPQKQVEPEKDASSGSIAEEADSSAQDTLTNPLPQPVGEDASRSHAQQREPIAGDVTEASRVVQPAESESNVSEREKVRNGSVPLVQVSQLPQNTSENASDFATTDRASVVQTPLEPDETIIILTSDSVPLVSGSQTADQPAAVPTTTLPAESHEPTPASVPPARSSILRGMTTNSPRASRKRKNPPTPSASILLSQPVTLTPPTTQPSPSPVPDRSQSVVSQRSEVERELDRITSGLQKVRDAAASIEASSRALGGGTARATSASAGTDDVGEASQGTTESRPRKRRRRNNGQPPTAEEQAAEIVANAIGASDLAPRHRRRRRGATPEDAEDYEIEEEATMMGELCDDPKWGKKSEIEKQMEANWPEILRRRQEDTKARLEAGQEGRRGKNKPTREKQANDAPDYDVAPEVVIENGVIIVTNREIDRAHRTALVADEVTDVREDTDIYKRVHQWTVGYRQQLPQGVVWSEEQTERFYLGLQMFGTDFKMISNMIEGKNRRQVKLKYNVEERNNWNRVKQALSQKEAVNLEQYGKDANMEFSNVEEVYKMMEDDEKKLRAEDEERRKNEGIISHDQPRGEGDPEADVVMPSIEGEDGVQQASADGAVGEDIEHRSTISRIGSTTTGRQTAQPTGKKKANSRKVNPVSKAGRKAAAKKSFEGVEERIGDIADVGMPGF